MRFWSITLLWHCIDSYASQNGTDYPSMETNPRVKDYVSDLRSKIQHKIADGFMVRDEFMRYLGEWLVQVRFFCFER